MKLEVTEMWKIRENSRFNIAFTSIKCYFDSNIVIEFMNCLIDSFTVGIEVIWNFKLGCFCCYLVVMIANAPVVCRNYDIKYFSIIVFTRLFRIWNSPVNYGIYLLLAITSFMEGISNESITTVVIWYCITSIRSVENWIQLQESQLQIITSNLVEYRQLRALGNVLFGLTFAAAEFLS